MSILNTKAGDHPHVQVFFPFRMSRKRAWKPKRSLGGPVAHAALSWWPRDRNPARVRAPRTARSCWERVGKKPRRKIITSSLRLSPARPQDAETGTLGTGTTQRGALPIPVQPQGAPASRRIRSSALGAAGAAGSGGSGAARRILGSFLGLQRPLLRHGQN